MEPYENTDYESEAPRNEPPVQANTAAGPEQAAAGDYSYRGAGAGRRESPYANSPYAGYQPPRQDAYQYTPQYTAPPRQKKPMSPVWKRVLASALVLALVIGSCAITAAVVNSRWERKAESLTESLEASFSQRMDSLEAQLQDARKQSAAISGGIAASGGLTPAQVYAANVGSVVGISSTIQTNSFYGTSTGTATGSGFILTEDGYVITNCHVIDGATAVSVTTHDGTEYPAQIIGSDATNDVAVLKVEATGLQAVTLGSSDSLITGDMVVAIGNPLGTLSATQTVGYVSGKDRDVTTDGSIISMIQTDAAINSGNSGGPLFNTSGEVVGITTAKYSGTTGSGASIEGIGFAIPIDDVKGIISDLIDYGYVTGAYLGVTVQDTDSASASAFGLPTGAYVTRVEPGSAAANAGIQPKDMIIQLGDTKITGITTLTRALRNFKAGDTTTITIIRSGNQMELTITLDEKPQASAVSDSDPVPMPSEGNAEEWYDYYFRHFFGQ